LGRTWKELPEDQKQPYLEKHKIDKERYKRELEEYNKKKTLSRSEKRVM